MAQLKWNPDKNKAMPIPLAEETDSLVSSAPPPTPERNVEVDMGGDENVPKRKPTKKGKGL